MHLRTDQIREQTRNFLPNPAKNYLNKRELIGGNVKGIDIGSKAGIGLLGPIGAITIVSICISRNMPGHVLLRTGSGC